MCKCYHGGGLVVQFVRTSSGGPLPRQVRTPFVDIIGSKSSQCARLRPYTATRISRCHLFGDPSSCQFSAERTIGFQAQVPGGGVVQ